MTGQRQKVVLEAVQALHFLACLRLFSDLDRRDKDKIDSLPFFMVQDWRNVAIPYRFLPVRRQRAMDFCYAQRFTTLQNCIPDLYRPVGWCNERRFIPLLAYQAAPVALVHTCYDIKIAWAPQHQSTCLDIIERQGRYVGIIKNQFEPLTLFLDFLCSLLGFVPGID